MASDVNDPAVARSRSRSDAALWIVAICIGTVTIVGWVVALRQRIDWFGRSFAIDYGIYMDALDRFASGGPGTRHAS